MDKLIFATGNEGKMKEVRMILADLGFEIQSESHQQGERMPGACG